MKVWRQDWTMFDGKQITSISKSREALKQTTKEASKAEKEKEGRGDWAVVDGEPEKITIPNDSFFADMARSWGTVFLNDNEMDVVYNAPEYD